MADFARKTLAAERTYTVSGAEQVLDSARCPIMPELGTVRFASYHGEPLHATWVAISGRRLRGKKTIGTYNRGGYSIDEAGTVEPDRRSTPAPPWVQQLVDLAIAEHNASSSDATVTEPAP